MTQELEQLKQEAIRGLDRFLTAVVSTLDIAPVAPTAEMEVVKFLKALMIEVFKNDVRFGVPSDSAGWGTIHHFWDYCKKMHPGWASKGTFYSRMNRCLPLLMSQGIVQRRPARRRHGMGRATYEFRMNPDHPDLKDGT